MFEILKKTYLTGVGLAAKTWDEVEVHSKEFAKWAKMSEKEGAKFLKDMKKRYDDTQKKTGKYVENVVKDILKKMDIATSADIKALKKEIQQLKKATASTAVQKRAGRKTTKKPTTTAAKKRVATKAGKKTTSRASTKKRAPKAGTQRRKS